MVDSFEWRVVVDDKRAVVVVVVVAVVDKRVVGRKTADRRADWAADKKAAGRQVAE